MNHKAASIVTGALVALTLPLAAPAVAAPPARGCPPPFELLTYWEQVALARTVLEISKPEAVALVDDTVAAIDKNGDRTLCYAFQNKATGEPNVVDNTSAAVRP